MTETLPRRPTIKRYDTCRRRYQTTSTSRGFDQEGRKVQLQQPKSITLLRSRGFDFGYVFLDQFEDSVMSASTGKMGELGLGIRRMLEASSGKASIIVTLHPDSEQKLNSNPAVQNLQRLAPIDENRYISLTAFNPASTLVIQPA